jgi:hypothetical protein
LIGRVLVRRRGWLIVAILAVMVAGIAFGDPGHWIWWTVGFSPALGTAGATLDLVLGGWLTSVRPPEKQAVLSSWTETGWRVGNLAADAGGRSNTPSYLPFSKTDPLPAKGCRLRLLQRDLHFNLSPSMLTTMNPPVRRYSGQYNSMFASFLILVAALTTALVVSRIGARAWELYRKIAYARHERNEDEIARKLPTDAFFQNRLGRHAEEIRKGATNLLKAYHSDAIRAQNKNHSAISSAVASVSLGFLGLSLGMTIGAEIDWLVRFCATLDVCCFVLAVVSFWRAIYYNRLWVTTRAQNEFLRQWCTVDNVLMSESSPDVTTRFERFAARVKTEINHPSLNSPNPGRDFLIMCIRAILATKKTSGSTEPDLSQAVILFWRSRRAEIMNLLSTEIVDNARLVTHYLKRPLTQAEWFSESRKRLEGYSSHRAMLLLWAFGITLLLALLKCLLVFHVFPHSWLEAKPYVTLAILVLIGISSMLTALYVNQNTRSLTHRYGAQERKIDDWLSKYNFSLTKLSREDIRDAPSPLPSPLVDQILSFEDLMIDELLDWIAISEEDIMELSAS